MKLDRIYLKNFKRFRDQEITFHDGITGIIGNNGSGKSTIIEAVLFALYGIKSTGLDGDFIVSSFASPRDACEVRLEFTVGGDHFTVLRTFRKGRSSTQHDAQLNRGPDLLATGVSDVERQVVRIIGMGAPDFKNTIFAGQKDLLSLLDERPGARKEWFMRVLGIDFLKKESDMLLKEQVDSAQKRSDRYGTLIAELDRERLESEYEKISGELDSLNNEREVLLLQKKDIDMKKRELERDQAALSEKRERFFQLSGQKTAKEEQIKWLSSEINRLRSELADLRAHEDEYRKLSEINESFAEQSRIFEEISDRKKQYEKLNAEKGKITEIIHELTEQRSQYEAWLAALEDDEQVARTLRTAAERREKYQQELDALARVEPEYRNLVEQLGVVGAQYREFEGRAHTLRDEIESLQATVENQPSPEELEDEVAGLRKDGETLIADISAYNEKERRIKQEIEEQNLHLSEIRNAGLEGNCPTCNRPLGEQYPRIVEGFEGEIRRLKAELISLAREKTELEGKRQRIEEMFSERTVTLDQMKRIYSKILDIKSERRVLVQKVEECLQVRAELEDCKKKAGYNPDRKHELEVEIRRLEEPLRRYLEAQERLKRRNSIGDALERIRSQIETRSENLVAFEQSINEIAYDEARYENIKRRYDEATAAHKKFLEMKSEMERIPRIENQIQEKSDGITGIENEIHTIAGELDGLAFSPGTLDHVQKDLEECREQQTLLTKKIYDADAKVQVQNEKKAQIESGQKRLKEYEEQFTSCEQEIALLRQTRSLVGEYITYLMSIVRQRIEGEVGRVIGQITDGRYENVLIDENFTVLVSDMGDVFPANRFSGGEQDDIAIALRIALSHYLAELHQLHDSTFLIFDEIFGSQDEERRNSLIQALRTQESRFPQIFLISHISEIQGEFSTTLQVEAGTNSTSIVRELS